MPCNREEITSQDLAIQNSDAVCIDKLGLELGWEMEKFSRRKTYFTWDLRPKTCICVGKGRIGAGKHFPGGKENVCRIDKTMAKNIHSEARESGSKSWLCHWLPENDFFMPQFSQLYNGGDSNYIFIIKIEEVNTQKYLEELLAARKHTVSANINAFIFLPLLKSQPKTESSTISIKAAHLFPPFSPRGVLSFTLSTCITEHLLECKQNNLRPRLRETTVRWWDIFKIKNLTQTEAHLPMNQSVLCSKAQGDLGGLIRDRASEDGLKKT